MRYNSRTGVRQPMPFRKHQVDCLHLWKLPSHGKLLRRLLAIFNIRAGAERAGACRKAPSGRISSESRARRWLGPPCGRVLSSRTEQKGGPLLVNINMRGCPRRAERARHGHPRQRKAICRAHPHSSESQNEVPARIGRQERVDTIHQLKKIRGIYLRKDGCIRPLSTS